ncbi:amidase signature enzyme [Viridothelium virens]|uniref:Amidase signature enzyme n=1 Tax=Viridothelium virens TaxID=1048519 RepID=A0A6A6GZX2_VIRVR|nr:amidase signature enzyme [Viridothelium virens]
MHFLFYAVLCALFSNLVVAKSVIPRQPPRSPLSKRQTTIKGQQFPSLINVTTEDLVSGLEQGLFTSVDLTTAYVQRIREVNDTLHMVTELNPDALAIAAQADARRANGSVIGPLDGIPILIKNNIATDDQMNNTAGSYALLGAKVPRDSTIAAKLRKAGVVILGKTNLSQWANFRSDNSTNGWSAYGGQTFAGYYPFQDPSGSSSGSGVSSSLGLALAALGTETSGSILSPSDVNNLAGIKPSVGLTSRYLVVPISEHQDTVGPMARTVKDAAYLLQAIAGPDPNDNYTSAIPNNGSIPDYVAACNFTSLEGARIGIARNVIDLSSDNSTPPVLAAFDAAVQVIREAGATVIDNTNFTAYEQWLSDNNETLVLNADFLVDLANYFNELTFNPNDLHNLAELTNYTHANPLEDWPDRDTAVWDGRGGALQQGWNNTDPRFWPAYQANLFYGGPGGILGALDRNNLDAILLPTQFSPGIPALVGSPVVTVPMGFYPSNETIVLERRGTLVETGPQIPFGLSFLGRRFSEAQLIGFAYAYEQRTMIRNQEQPYIVPNIELADVVA